MTLDIAAREYYVWPVVADVDPVPAIQLSTDGIEWHDTEPVTGGVRALLAGPEATGNPADTVVLRDGVNRFLARAVDNPEVVIRGGGDIRCGRSPM